MTIMLYTVFWVLITFSLLFTDVSAQVIYAVWFYLAAVMFGNYFRILIVVQYRKFCQEQQQIIDRLKQP